LDNRRSRLKTSNLYDILDEKRRQVYQTHRRIKAGKHIGGNRYRQNIEDMYDTKLKYFLKERIYEIKSELEAFDFF